MRCRLRHAAANRRRSRQCRGDVRNPPRPLIPDQFGTPRGRADPRHRPRSTYPVQPSLKRGLQLTVAQRIANVSTTIVSAPLELWRGQGAKLADLPVERLKDRTWVACITIRDGGRVGSTTAREAPDPSRPPESPSAQSRASALRRKPGAASRCHFSALFVSIRVRPRVYSRNRNGTPPA